VRTLLPIALLLAGCGAADGPPADDPANPPRYGLWEVERLPTRVVRNGLEAPKGGEGPGSFISVYGGLKLGMPDGKEACGEPRPADAAWIERHMAGQLGRACKVTRIERDGAAITGDGVCGEGDRGGPSEASFRFSGTDGPERLNVKATALFTDRRDTGETHAIELGIGIEGRRLGECMTGNPGLAVMGG
jgi:hypothetical protein